MTENKQLKALSELGQSIWYDNLSRDVLQSGELAELIAVGVRGLTSNPTIFEKAISKSDKYDQAIKNIISNKEISDEDLCFELMIEDVGQAADLLRPVFESSKGEDGYASIEVSPFLANDTQGTIAAAENIWKALDRQNVMIKVPATEAGIPAIKDLLTKGINVNITLIFSNAVYSSVADAYIEALETRKAQGQKVDHIASVASFFVSRVDSAVEKEVQRLNSANEISADTSERLIGAVGVANSKVAYATFKEKFIDNPKFKALMSDGAQVQRPLWASTGVKNPDFIPVYYVEQLAGPHTVNTLPPATLNSLMESAVIENRLAQGLDESEQVLSLLGSANIDLNKILYDLQVAGVKSFADSFSALLSSISDKRKQLG